MKRQLPDGIIISTLYGEEIASKRCNTCDEIKYKYLFYRESPSKRKNTEQVRNQCNKCWSRFKGRSKLGRKVLNYEKSENIK